MSVFTDNILFESVYYKGESKIPLLFDIVLLLQQVQIRGYLILHAVNIFGKRMVEAGIDGLLRLNNS